MRPTALLLFFLSLSANAQNWALLNPAYKYNYSNDGTDTISNQVFVTHIDSLGPDSFVYQLNRVGEQCDTCPASLGGQCDGCFIRVDRPQFLGWSCSTDLNDWHLQTAVGERVVRSTAGIGSSWTFDPLNTITATVTSIAADTTLGQPDSLKTISLSDGSSIMLSLNFGVVQFPSGHSLVGHQTLGFGAVIPEVTAFFPFQVGDVAQYERHSGYNDLQSQYGYGSRSVTKQTFTSVTLVDDTLQVVFDHIDRSISSSNNGGNTFVDTTFSSGTDTVLHPSSWDEFPGLLSSYPGQVILSSTELVGEVPLACIAEHGVDGNGDYFIQARSFSGGSGDFVFAWVEEAAPGILRAGPCFEPQCGLRYSTKYGFEHLWVEWLGWSTYETYGRELIGSVISGDTMGIISPSEELVGVMERDLALQFNLSPVPTSEQLTLNSSTTAIVHWRILDIRGMEVRNGNVNGSARLSIDVTALAPGSYLFNLNTAQGTSTRRFIVAR